MNRRIRSTNQLGDAVAALRRDQGMTQADLAAWVGVDRTTIVRLEAGQLAVVDRLLEVLATLSADLLIVDRGTSA